MSCRLEPCHPECVTAAGLTRIGDLVEGHYADLLRLPQNGERTIRSEGGSEELDERYCVMKYLKPPTRSLGQRPDAGFSWRTLVR